MCLMLYLPQYFFLILMTGFFFFFINLANWYNFMAVAGWRLKLREKVKLCAKAANQQYRNTKETGIVQANGGRRTSKLVRRNDHNNCSGRSNTNSSCKWTTTRLIFCFFFLKHNFYIQLSIPARWVSLKFVAFISACVCVCAAACRQKIFICLFFY